MTKTMDIQTLKKINWKQPKYMIPFIIYVPLLFAGYFVIDLFYTKKAEIPDSSMATTEYLNPELPDARMRGDGIGNKYESMLKSYGRIDDYTAMNNIDRNNKEEKEGYDSKYSDEEREQIESQEAQKHAELQRQLQESAQKGQEIASGNILSEEDQLARSQQREREAMDELNRVLAQARLEGQRAEHHDDVQLTGAECHGHAPAEPPGDAVLLPVEAEEDCQGKEGRGDGDELYGLCHRSSLCELVLSFFLAPCMKSMWLKGWSFPDT